MKSDLCRLPPSKTALQVFELSCTMGLLLRKATSNVEHSGSKRGKLDAVDLPHYRCHLQRGTAALSRPLRVRVPGVPGSSASYWTADLTADGLYLIPWSCLSHRVLTPWSTAWARVLSGTRFSALLSLPSCFPRPPATDSAY